MSRPESWLDLTWWLVSTWGGWGALILLTWCAFWLALALRAILRQSP